MSQRRARMLGPLLFVLFLLAGLGAQAARAADRPAAFTDALRQVEGTTAYRFTANVEQRLLPRPGTYGALREERIDLFVAGSMAGQRFSLTIRGEDESLVPASRLFGGPDGTYIERAGQVEKLEDPADAPLGVSLDQLSLLTIAGNVRALPDQTRAGETFRVFAFDIAGADYAELMRQAYLAAFGDQLPPGATLDLNPLDLASSGAGEVWIDAAGWPVRQDITLFRPEVTGDYDAQIRFLTDFSDFDAVTTMPAAVEDATGALSLQDQSLPSSPLTIAFAAAAGAVERQALPLLLVAIALGLLVVITLIHLRRPRLAYRILAVLISIIMLVTPLLQPAAYAQSVDRIEAFRQENNPDPAASGPLEGLAAADVTSLPAGIEPSGSLQPPAAPAGAGDARIAQCGDGLTTADFDGDGLTDFQESCLGTNPYLEDTDTDLISDFAEVTGFDVGGQTWFGDPFRADSNMDGLPDYAEWTSTTYTITDSLGVPHVISAGLAANFDVDGDNVPNLWDDDNDNDGVSDARDLSPSSAQTTDAAQHVINTQFANPGGDMFQTVEIQVRPANPDHLRFSIGRLDWPQDAEGQIQDPGNVPDDLRLIPMLRVTSNRRPGAESLYGYAAATQTPTGAYELLVPTAPVQDAGRIAAFAAKLAFEPSQAVDVQLTASLVWVAVVGSPGKPAHVYAEDSRITGLEIGRSGQVKMGYFAAPDTPLEDADLFQFAFALNSTFMAAKDYELQTVFDLIAQEQLATAWGIDANFTALSNTYPNLDQAILRANTNDFLTSTFPPGSANACLDAGGQTSYCATIAVATDYRAGFNNLDSLSSPQTLSFDLNGSPVVHERTVRVGLYEQAGPGSTWRPMSAGRTAEMISVRYSDTDAIVASLGAEGVNVRADDVRVNAILPYIVWSGGVASTVAIGDATLPGPYPIDLDSDGLNDQVSALVDSVGNSLTVPGLVIDITEGHVEYKQSISDSYTDMQTQLNELQAKYLTDQNADALQQGGDDVYTNYEKSTSWARTERGWQIATQISGAAILAASLTVGLLKSICASDVATCELDEDALDIVDYAVQAVTLATEGASLVLTSVKISKYGAASALGFLDDNGVRVGAFKSASKAAKVAAVVGLIVEVGLTWVNFALTVIGGVNVIQFKLALAAAIVQTIIAIVFFFISFIPVVGQIIELIKLIIDIILLIIDIILKAVGIDASAADWLIQQLIAFFYDVLVITELEPGFGFENEKLSVTGDGLLEGEQIKVSADFVGIVRQILREGLTRDTINSPQRIAESYIRGTYSTHTADGGGVDGAIATFSNASSSTDCGYWTFSSETERRVACTNSTEAVFVIQGARRNVTFRIAQLFEYRLRYAECAFYGTVCEIIQDLDGTLPGEDEAPIIFDFTLDILPASLDGLWTWSEIANLDLDGDGLLDASEAGYGTDPANWDTDGDGLSDGFEAQTGAALGLSATAADGDGDGLSDYHELRWNTRGDVADGDGDGLLDGQEICRVENGALVGARQVVTTNGTLPVCGDAGSDDGDLDGLVDAAEAALGTSPYAHNAGPAVHLLTLPRPQNHQGVAKTVVEPGDVVAFGVQVINVTAIDTTNQLQLCLPGNVNLTGGGTTTGARVINPTPGTCGNGGDSLTWDLTGQNRLLPGEIISTTLTAGALSDVPPVGPQDATLSLGWNNQTVSMTVPIIVDEDDPSVAITFPQDGQAVGRTPNQSTVLIRGTASDPSSWVRDVSVNLQNTTAVVGLESWETRWTLPATDGYYDIAVTAADAVSRTANDSVAVFVDGAPPVVISTIPDVLAQSNDGAFRVDLPLTGTATDADVRPRGSTIARVEARFDGGPWRSATVTEVGTSGLYNWTLSQTLDVVNAQGTHSVQVRAWDGVGNVSPVLEDSFVVDTTPPNDTALDSRLEDAPYPSFNTTTGATLSGFANDAGLLPAQSVPAPLVGTVDPLREATVWLSPDSQADASGGFGLSWLGDVNGDGRADLAVGMPGADNGAGQIVVVNGRAGDWPQPEAAELLSGAKRTFVGAPGAGLGGMVAAAGDVDGDSLYDVLVGDPANDRFFVLLGTVGAATSAVTLDAATTDAGILRFDLPAGGPLAGLTAAGDVNGDGADDIFVRAGQELYLLNGGTLLSVVADVATAAGIRETGITGATGVGDVDGDGFDDFVVTGAAGTELVAGQALFGSGAGAALTERTLLDATSRPVTPLGDLDADGRADFLLGGPAAQVWLNGTAERLFDNQDYSAFQRGVGDVNADGCADILLGGTDGNGYLFLSQNGGGACSPPVETEVTVLIDVADAAPAPYAAGADLNCDQSSDLLLVPGAAMTRRSELDATGSSFAPPPALRRITAAPAPLQGCANPTAIYVDDDWAGAAPGSDPDGSGPATSFGCDAFATLASALTGATAGDTIAVNAGVYAGFSRDFAALQGVTLQGGNAETVIVDAGGGDALTIQNAQDVTIDRITIRNANRALVVTNSPRLDVTNSVLHDFNNALFADRSSYVNFTRSTVAGGTGSGAYVTVDGSAPPDPNRLQTWSQLPASPANEDKQLLFSYDNRDGLGLLPVPWETIYTLDASGPNWVQRGHNLDASGLAPNSTQFNEFFPGIQLVDKPQGAYALAVEQPRYTAFDPSPRVPAFRTQIAWTSLASAPGSDGYSDGALFGALDNGQYQVYTVSPAGLSSTVVGIPGWFDACNGPFGSEKWVAPVAANEQIAVFGGKWCDGNPATADNLLVHDIATGAPALTQPAPLPAEVASAAVTALALDGATIIAGFANGYVARHAAGVWTLLGRLCLSLACTETSNLPAVGSIVVRPDGDLFVANMLYNATYVRNASNAAMTPIRQIARYDATGDAWHALLVDGQYDGFGGTDGDNTVDTMLAVGDALYVAGTFETLADIESPATTPAPHVVRLTLDAANEVTAWRSFASANPALSLTPYLNRAHRLAVVGDALYLAGNLNRGHEADFYTDSVYFRRPLLRWSEAEGMWQPVTYGQAYPELAACDFGDDTHRYIGTDVVAGNGRLFSSLLCYRGGYSSSSAYGGLVGMDFGLFTTSYVYPATIEQTRPLFHLTKIENPAPYPTTAYTDAVPLSVPPLEPAEGILDAYRQFYSYVDANLDLMTSLGDDLYAVFAVSHPTYADAVPAIADYPELVVYKLGGGTNQWSRIGGAFPSPPPSDQDGWQWPARAVATPGALWILTEVSLDPGFVSSFVRLDLETETFQPVPLPGSLQNSIRYVRPQVIWDGADSLYFFNAEYAAATEPFMWRYDIGSGAFTLVGGNDFIPPGSLSAAYYSRHAAAVYREHMVIGDQFFQNIWQWGPLNRAADKILLNDTVLVPRPNAEPTAWLSTLPVDVAARATGTVWVDGVWIGEQPPTSTVSLADAAFQDPTLDLYRPGATSVLAGKGYADYAPPAQVAAGACDGCANPFTTIQAAVDSGARDILVTPGLYQESVSLPGGVALRGLDAESAVIGASEGAVAVRLEGTASATVSRFTFLGGGDRTAVSVEDGARLATVGRNLIRDWENGVVVGNGSQAAVTNNTIAGSANGVQTQTCGYATITNNALTGNTAGLNLVQTGCGNTTVQSYNAYWQNGDNLIVDGVPNTGLLDGTNVFQDPLFEDAGAGNYRLTAGSPLIDAGLPDNNATYVPDIGYREFATGDVLVSNDFCATCDNGGLTWGVDAFSAIQPAVDAAAAAITAQGCGVLSVAGDVCDRVATVRVLPGTYEATFALASHVHVLGSGAEQTTLIRFEQADEIALVDGVSDARLAGFTFTAAPYAVVVRNASNRVLIDHNIFTGVLVGVDVSGQSVVDVTFNTIVANLLGLRVTGLGSSTLVDSNILTENFVALQSEAGNQTAHTFNLLHNNTTDFDGTLTPNASEILGQDPLLDADSVPAAGSPAIDAADPRAAVPIGGGARADIGYRERVATPLALLFGQVGQSCVFGSTGVAADEYGLVPVTDPTSNPFGTPPGSWTLLPLNGNPADGSRSWNLALPALADGLYRLYTRPADGLGNVTRLANDWYRGSFYSDSTAPTLSWLTEGGTVTDLAEYPVAASAGDAALASVRFVVNGVTVQTDLLPTAGMTMTARAVVPLQLGVNQVQAVATDAAGNETSDTIDITATALNPPPPSGDATPPVITIQPNGYVTQTTTLAGTAVDPESGVYRVDVSLDGGVVWRTAVLQGTGWSLDWAPTQGIDYRPLPLMVRAINEAGLTTTVRAANDALVVDNLPPQFTGEVDFNLLPEFHYDGAQTITMTWVTVDGNPGLTYFGEANTLTSTVPTTPLAGNSASFDMSAAGTWYVHLKAEDSAGNGTVVTVGPWYVGTPPGTRSAPNGSGWTESILLDGVIDPLHNEWIAGETIDTDERSGLNRTFYTNWDGSGLFFALQGAVLAVDGTLDLHLDTGAGGTTTGLGSVGLPFAADYAVRLDENGNGTFYAYSGGAWNPTALPGFVALHGGGAGSEIFVPYGLFGPGLIRAVATVTGLNGARTSAFPTRNPLAGPLTDAYEWFNTGADIQPAGGQPRSFNLDLVVISNPPGGNVIGAGQLVNYEVAVTSGESEILSGIALTGDGMGMADVPWVDLPDITPGQTVTLTVTSQPISPPGNALTPVSLALSMFRTEDGEPIGAGPVQVAHEVDRAAPEAMLDTTDTWLGPGGILFGAASDEGGGVALVEVNLGGGWTPATGQTFWRYQLPSVPGGTAPVSVRATDRFGNTSVPADYNIPVDTGAPTVAFGGPTVLTRLTALLSGTASDALSGVNQVEVRLGDSQIWRPATFRDGAWQYAWRLPAADNQVVNVAVRAVDRAGNVSAVVQRAYTVDSMAPNMTVTQLFDSANIAAYGGETLLSGTVSDGSGVASIVVRQFNPNGTETALPVTVSNGAWSFAPALAETGLYLFQVEATDGVGNLARSRPLLLTVDGTVSTDSYIYLPFSVRP